MIPVFLDIENFVVYQVLIRMGKPLHKSPCDPLFDMIRPSKDGQLTVCGNCISK